MVVSSCFRGPAEDEVTEIVWPGAPSEGVVERALFTETTDGVFAALGKACVLIGLVSCTGILGIDKGVRSGYGKIGVMFDIDADAPQEDIEALVAQSQKRSAVYDIVTNSTCVEVDVRS